MALLVGSLLLTTAAGTARAATYYVNATLGDDRNDGLSDAKPWRSLAKIRDVPLRAGDAVLLASGSVWREPLVISRSGSRDAPIRIERTGTGLRPRIDAGGVSQHGVAILNAEFVSISGLEVTNDGPPGAGPRFGVLVAAENSGVTRGIRIADMYIHDVRGTNDRKDNGGIVFRALGPRLPTRFEGITIERNIIWRVDRSGIAGISDQVTAARWFPSRQVVIRDNYLEDIGGDGIVPRGTDGTLVEHNVVRGAAARAPGYNVAIWQWSTDHTLIQLNEAALTRGRYDGQGFASDFNSRRTTIIYNYSHDNAGGFLLVCTPVVADPAENIGNKGTVAQFNVSYNDRERIFQLGGGSDAL
ncbi:MAG: right-handed parallel beta-helix repeat-containing protein, partial [Sphingobium sp.]